MKLRLLMTALVGCLALICGAGIVWHFAKVRVSHRKLAEEANACQLRAEHGDANAQYELARRYYQGKGLPQDYTKALSLYRKAADQGNASAQYGVGFMYEEGEGAPQDYSNAASWYRKAADQGNSKAQYGLACLYHEGRGVTQDRNAAIELWRKAADQGSARAQYALGYIYFEGKDLPQDYTTAIASFRKAADQGDPLAETYLGYMYHQGKGVQRDVGEGVRWYRKSAEQGNSRAQYDLGYMYYYGDGVPQDRVEANRLFHAAASQGDEAAKRFVGLNKSRPVDSRFMLPLDFLASFYFAVVFLKFDPSRRNRAQVMAGVTALLPICAFVINLFWYGYIGHLQSSPTITTLYFVRHLLSGLIVALLLVIIIPKRAKVILACATALFITYIVIQTLHCKLKHIPPTIRLICFVGFPIGMAIPPALILWLERKNNGQVGPDDADIVPLTMK